LAEHKHLSYRRCQVKDILRKAKFRPKLPYTGIEILLCRVLYYFFVFRFRISSKRQYRRLHVGCGRNRFKNWINSDVTLGSDLIVFLQKRLPFNKNHLDLIYSEHVLEHVPYDTGVFFLKEAYRVLRPQGVLRIAMPDLDDLVDSYQKDWRCMDWVKWPQFAFIQTRAEMINIAFRWWGHQHLYNREELERALKSAGFEDIRFEAHGQSRHKDLVGLETRMDSKLIAEAVKA
jgi:predicted SAM-dependent methyltransferase